MLVEALEIIEQLFAGETVTYRGTHIMARDARLWDLPPVRPDIGVAVSGREGCAIAGQYADAMIAVQPVAELGEWFDAAGGTGRPRIGQAALSYDPDPEAARKRAHEQFRWFTAGWEVMAELPRPSSFAAAANSVAKRTSPRRSRAAPTSMRRSAR